MESISFPGGKHVGIMPSSRPSRAVAQAINLGMLYNAAGFMRAANRTCRVHDEYRKLVASTRAKRDRQAYLNKCYPRFFYAWGTKHDADGRTIRHLSKRERLSNGNVVVASR